jgi:hypothetical protein
VDCGVKVEQLHRIGEAEALAIGDDGNAWTGARLSERFASQAANDAPIK